MRAFVTRLGIAKAAFMTATNATFKVGIEFCDFGVINDRYVYPFASYGQPLGGVGFHHYWLRRNWVCAVPTIG